MLNPPPLNVQLYCAIRNKGYTTTDQTYEVVEAVLGVLSQQTPAPVPAPDVPELDPMTRLIVSDPKQLKPKKQEPAVPSVVFMAHNKTSSILFAARKDADQYAASFGPAAGVSVTECAVIGSQSAPQAPAVSAEWREVMTELAADVQAACDAEHPHRDQYPSVMRKYNNDMGIVEKARALLQSAEVRHD